MIVSLIWAIVLMYLMIRAEINFKAWLGLQKPLNQEQMDSLDKRIKDLQSQVSRLSIDKEYS